MTKWDPSLHPHGMHGQWATVGGTKSGRKKVDRSVGEGRGIVGRSINAFQPPESAAQARARKERVPTKVRGVNAAYKKIAAGTATSRDREFVSWDSPRKRAEQTRKTGSPVKDKADAIHTARAYNRPGIAFDRTTIKKTFTGKKYAVRGEHRYVEVPLPGRPGSTHEVADRRVRRAFPGPVKKKSARALMAKPTTEYVGRRRAAG